MSLHDSPQTVAVDGQASPSLVEPLSQIDSKPHPANAIQPDDQSKQSSSDGQYLSTPSPHLYSIYIDDFETSIKSTRPVVNKEEEEVEHEVCQTHSSHWLRQQQSPSYQSVSDRSFSPYHDHGINDTTYVPLDDSSESDPFADEDQPELDVSISDDSESNDSEDDSSRDSFNLIDPTFQISTLRVFDNNGPLDKQSESIRLSSGRHGYGVPLFWEGAEMGYDLTEMA
jgi:hypothetical protein